LKHQGKEKWKEGFPTITKAREWRNSRKGRAAERRLFPEQEHEERERLKNETPLFRDYAPIWLQDCRTKGLKYSTLLRYEGILEKHLIPAFGDLRMDEISREKVRELACSLKAAQAAPKTIHNVIRVLSAIFTLAYENKPLPFNPARNPSKLVKLRKGRRAEVFSHEEEILILDKVKATLPHWYPFVLLLFRTGLREGEAVALEPGIWICGAGRSGSSATIRRDTRRTRRRTGKSGRWIWWTPSRAIWRFRKPKRWRPAGRGRGGCSRRRKGTLSGRTISGIGYATRLIMNGANLVYVQKQLGHSSIKITVDLYTHWIEAVDRGHTREVDRLMLVPGGGTSGGGPGSQRTRSAC
jgi:integrase